MYGRIGLKMKRCAKKDKKTENLSCGKNDDFYFPVKSRIDIGVLLLEYVYNRYVPGHRGCFCK